MPRASKAETQKRRKAVAKGIVAGKKPKQIAAEAGCTTRHVERMAAEPETQFLITEALRPHRKALERLVEKAIKAVGSGLAAKKTLRADKFNGKSTTVDHLIRLKAVERLSDLCELAQGKPKDESENTAGLVTWEEFVVLYRSRKETSEPSR